MLKKFTKSEVAAMLTAAGMTCPDPDETPETEPEPDETTHSDDWGDTENDDNS